MEENIDPTAANGDAAETQEPPTRSGRPRLLWLLAAVLAVVGVVILTVAITTSRSGPPQPAADAAGTIDAAEPTRSADPAPPNVLSTAPSSSATTSSPAPPIDPSQSSDPAASATASTPTGASGPRSVAAPAQPGTPAAPSKPATPAKPAAPVKPLPPPKLATRGLLLPASPPVSLAVPAIGVTSPLIDLGLNPDNTVQVPDLDDPDSKAGWYEYSPTPGSLGPAIILGHIDSKKYGPGVFYNLGKLKPGDTVDVTRKDGKVAVFRIDGVRSYPKDNFPTQEVYGNLDHAGLRLITCGGVFDPDKGSYESNIVAFASLASVHPA